MGTNDESCGIDIATDRGEYAFKSTLSTEISTPVDVRPLKLEKLTARQFERFALRIRDVQHETGALRGPIRCLGFLLRSCHLLAN